MSTRATSLVDAAATAPDNRQTARVELARRELLSFPALHLTALPLPLRISVQISGFAHSITLFSASLVSPEPGARGALVFDGEELRAIAVAVQAERMWPADFKGFCLHKLHDSSFRLSARLALAGAQPLAIGCTAPALRGGVSSGTAPAWPLGRVLRWLDLELIDFAFVGDTGPVHPMRPDVAA